MALAADLLPAAIRERMATRVLFSVKEAAPCLNVSEDNVRLGIKDGTIRSVRLGNRVLIPVGEIIRLGAYDLAEIR